MFSIAVFIVGFWVIITARVPSVMTGTKHRVVGRHARLIGAILLLPLPIAFVSTLVLAPFLSGTSPE